MRDFGPVRTTPKVPANNVHNIHNVTYKGTLPARRRPDGSLGSRLKWACVLGGVSQT